MRRKTIEGFSVAVATATSLPGNVVFAAPTTSADIWPGDYWDAQLMLVA